MQGEPWSGEHRRGIAVCGLLKTTNSAASSKQARFFRHWRRIACFPCFLIPPRRISLRSKLARSKKETPPTGWCFFFGAGYEARTRYLHLGKVALYQMSEARKNSSYYSKHARFCQEVFPIFPFFLPVIHWLPQSAPPLASPHPASAEIPQFPPGPFPGNNAPATRSPPGRRALAEPA